MARRPEFIISTRVTGHLVVGGVTYVGNNSIQLCLCNKTTRIINIVVV